ncbi:MAG TPA: gliding motility protein GldN [Bacteroidia bacterium]|nr:gliding motility protein GldN [Bacteroidia bacterium]
MKTKAIHTLRMLFIAFLIQLCVDTVVPVSLHAQFPETFYVKENTRNRRPVAYVHERETDVMWSKRVWRTIDLREKFNHPLYYPESPINDRKSLFDIIKTGLLAGEITAFANPVFDDEFKVKITKSGIDSLMVQIDSMDVEDPLNPGTWIRVAVRTELESHSVKQFWVKEDWFFDRQRSVMDVRIIGLCPLEEKLAPNGDIEGYKPLFWIYFPQCRALFARSEIFNTKNDAARCSADDVFQKRMFSSFVRKESNVYDRSISSYFSGLDALLEAESVKEEISRTEHDVWHF